MTRSKAEAADRGPARAVTPTDAQLEALEALAAHYGAPDPQEELSFLDLGSFLILQQGGAGQEGARKAVSRILSSAVDWNEVRVSSLAELMAWCEPAAGAGGLRARCLELREYLANIYRDQNDVSLNVLQGMDLEERRKYLGGVPPLKPWMIHYLILAADRFQAFQFQNDMNRVLQRLGLIPREGSPRKAAEAAAALFGTHRRRVAWQCALVQHGLEVCVPNIRVSLCKACPVWARCPSSKFTARSS